MRLGDERTDDVMALMAPSHIWGRGVWIQHHVRCGTIHWERREVEAAYPEKSFRWVVIAIDRPDPDPEPRRDMVPVGPGVFKRTVRREHKS